MSHFHLTRIFFIILSINRGAINIPERWLMKKACPLHIHVTETDSHLEGRCGVCSTAGPLHLHTTHKLHNSHFKLRKGRGGGEERQA